jgi:hypothetical protein
MSSQINPNNIDGAYPVAGQDNNSQGFRDNFTNTKQNFQYAENEINDLQNKAVLKAALIGGVLDNNMNDNLIFAAKIQDFSATAVPVGTTVGSVLLNYAAGHYQLITTTGSVTLNFANFPNTGSYGYLRIQINITNVAHTLTLPASVSLGLSGIQGISPGTAGVSNTITFGVSGRYEFAFSTSDGGVTVTLFDLNRALTNFASADIVTDDVTASGFISATGNITGGNINSPGLASITGNIIGGNLITIGQTSSVGNIRGNNLLTSGLVSATGNVISNSSVLGFIRPAAGTSLSPSMTFAAGSLTSTVGAGSVEYDGVVFYAAPTSSQRGILPSMPFVCLQSDYVALNSAAAQKVFNTPANGSITLPGATTYMFEAVYFMTRAAGSTSHTTAVSFGGDATLTSITYLAEASTSTTNVLGAVNRIIGTAVGAVVVTGAVSTTTEVITIKLTGSLRTNTGGTLIPQFQFSAAPGGAPTVLRNSYFRLTPVGTSSVTSVGNWT